MKICIWGNIARTLLGNSDGGGELQIALLAKTLARGGHEVIIIDYETTEDFITDDGIKVLRIKGWDEGLRFVRIVTHRLPKLYKSLLDQKADIYYCRIRDFKHILAFWAARKVNAKFVLAMASDLDAMSIWMKLRSGNIENSGSVWRFFNSILIEFIYPVLLRKADLIMAQHKGQMNILLKRGIKSVIYPNLFDLKSIPLLSNLIHNDFIYVGWLDKRKGFAEFFELVCKSPSHTFKVIGPPRDKTGYLYYNRLKEFANVSLLGRLSHSETIFQIANSKALISTSPMEGFPNIFIEAWACGIPVLSLYVDPGAIIENERLGYFARGNLECLLQAMGSYEITNEFSNRAKDYIEHNHALNDEKILETLKLFSEI